MEGIWSTTPYAGICFGLSGEELDEHVQVTRLGSSDSVGNEVSIDMDAARVRSATPGNAEALADLLVALSFPGLAKLSRGDVVGQLHQKLDAAQAPSHTLLVAELETRIVAYAAVQWLPCLFQPGVDGYLSELFVAAARGLGVGTRLLQTVYDRARERGCTRYSSTGGTASRMGAASTPSKGRWSCPKRRGSAIGWTNRVLLTFLPSAFSIFMFGWVKLQTRNLKVKANYGYALAALY